MLGEFVYGFLEALERDLVGGMLWHGVADDRASRTRIVRTVILH